MDFSLSHNYTREPELITKVFVFVIRCKTWPLLIDSCAWVRDGHSGGQDLRLTASSAADVDLVGCQPQRGGGIMSCWRTIARPDLSLIKASSQGSVHVPRHISDLLSHLDVSCYREWDRWRTHKSYISRSTCRLCYFTSAQDGQLGGGSDRAGCLGSLYVTGTTNRLFFITSCSGVFIGFLKTDTRWIW